MKRGGLEALELCRDDTLLAGAVAEVCIQTEFLLGSKTKQFQFIKGMEGFHETVMFTSGVLNQNTLSC